MIDPHGSPLDYSRHNTLGLPHIGTPDLVPDDELRRKTREFWRFGYASFNSERRGERFYGRTYGEVWEGVLNRRYKLIHHPSPVIETDGSVTNYIEWAEPYAISKDAEVPARIEPESQDTSVTSETVIVLWDKRYTLQP